MAAAAGQTLLNFSSLVQGKTLTLHTNNQNVHRKKHGRNGELLLAGRGPCFYYHFFPSRCAKHKPKEPIMVLWEFTFFKRASAEKGKFKIIHQVFGLFFLNLFLRKTSLLCRQREQRLSS